MRVGITGHRALPEPVAREVNLFLYDHARLYDAASLVAVSCLADGPDTWWAQHVLAVGGRLEAVIPAGEYREGLPAWHHRQYDDHLTRATAIHRTALTESTPEAHQTGSQLLVDHCDHLVAAWDGLPARGLGGTADVVAYARRVGTPVTVLWPEGASR
jgi:hypothetical protein